MSKDRYRKDNRYRKQRIGKSVFDGNPTLILNHYWLPKQYIEPVHNVFSAMMSGTPFNRAVDQVIRFYPELNRNKLAEHTLKWIANQY